MKTILLLRHAKSDRDNPALADYERPLAKRGFKDAPRMGAVLASFEMRPDRILASPARRAKETAELVAEACGYKKEIEWHEAFYGGNAEDLIAALQRLPHSVEKVLLVGHNPTMEETVSALISGDEQEPIIAMPTAALACLQIDIRDWVELEPGEGLLQWFLTPRLVKAIEKEAEEDTA
jgi:phosphohistidine phosphatase